MISKWQKEKSIKTLSIIVTPLRARKVYDNLTSRAWGFFSTTLLLYDCFFRQQ
jgi:hypothetical protein